MRIESLPVSRGPAPARQDQKPAPKEYEESGKDKPERGRSKDLNRAVELANRASELFNRHLKFKVMAGTDRTVIQIVDDKTGEVVKEIPPQKLLDMMDNVSSAIGLIIDRYI